jgi:hypothetical protein
MSTAPKPQMEVQDPVKVDPKHYKVEVENEKVRVLRANYKGREKSVMHSHPDSVAIFQNDVHCRLPSRMAKRKSAVSAQARRSIRPPEAICPRIWAVTQLM